MVVYTINNWLVQFLLMPTLEDTPDESAARAIYNLGQFMAIYNRTFLNSHYLESVVGPPCKKKALSPLGAGVDTAARTSKLAH